MKLMQNYSWPGNVRQLENAIESAIAMCDGNMIKLSDLPFELSDLPSEKVSEVDAYEGTLPQVVAMVERRMIQRALEQNDWVKARSAKSLGLSERVLTYKMEKYDIIKK
jgi:DNA-binding NtrC family response regulator